MPDIFINDPEQLTPEVADEQVEDTGMKPAHEILHHPKKNIHKIEGHTHNPLSSFFYFPDGVSFIAQDAHERIVLLLRKHPITNVPWIIGAVIMLFAPGVLSFFPLLEFMPERFQFVAVVLWYLLTTAFIFEKFLSWFFNVYVVTDERIFDVDFINLVYREIAEANLDQVQDVNVVMGSVIRTIFNYGEIQIQTASAVPNIEFEAVPDPDRIAKIIRELRVEEEQEKLEGRVR
ncbi:MAG: hypothetical protein AAB546_00545 [Patescibacteria group bacterium]